MSGGGGVWSGVGAGGLATRGMMGGRGIGLLVVVGGGGVWEGGGRNPRERGPKEGRWWGEAKIGEASRMIWAIPRWEVQCMRWRDQVRKAARSEGEPPAAEATEVRKS